MRGRGTLPQLCHQDCGRGEVGRHKDNFVSFRQDYWLYVSFEGGTAVSVIMLYDVVQPRKCELIS